MVERMTEKRFKVIKSEITGLYVPIDNNKEFVFEGVEKASTILKLTGLLNAQHEQIQKYKRYFQIPVKDDGSSMNIRELLEENEELKQQIKDMKIRFKRKYDHEFDEIVDELW